MSSSASEEGALRLRSCGLAGVPTPLRLAWLGRLPTLGLAALSSHSDRIAAATEVAMADQLNALSSKRCKPDLWRHNNGR